MRVGDARKNQGRTNIGEENDELRVEQVEPQIFSLQAV